MGLIAMTVGLATMFGIAGVVCLGAIIGGIVLYVKNSKANIYANDLNELLNDTQKSLNGGTKNNPLLAKEKMLFFLNEMLNKDENSEEYKSAKAFLEKDGELRVADFLKSKVKGSGNDELVKRDAIALLLKHGNNDQKYQALLKLNKILSSAHKDDELKSARNVLRTRNKLITDCLNNGNKQIEKEATAVLEHSNEK